MRTVKIRSISPVSSCIDTYDITVKTENDEERNFIANGIVVHNSNGIEPSFSHEYNRNIIFEGKKTKEQVKVYSFEALAYKGIIKPDPDEELPDYFSSADDLSPKEHIDMQAAVQPWIDSSISKCLAKGTRILTNLGIRKVEDLGFAKEVGVDKFSDPIPNLKVHCPDGIWRKVLSHYYGGKKKTKIVIFNSGYSLEGAFVHKVMTTDGWKQLDKLKIDDAILCKNNLTHSNKGGRELSNQLFYRNAKKVFLPTKMSVDLAKFIGMQLADGHISEDSGIVSLSNSQDEIIEVYKGLFEKIFKVTTKIVYDKRNSVKTCYFNSRSLCRWVKELCGYRSYNKHIPEQIMNGSRVEQLALVSSVTLDGYKTFNGSKEVVILYDGRSQELSKQLHSICSNLGYVSTLGKKWVKGYDYYTYSTRVYGFNCCLEDRKNSNVSTKKTHWVPLPKEVRNLQLSTDHCHYSWLRSLKQRLDQKICNSSVLDSLGINYDKSIYCIKVTEIQESENEVYDIEVEHSHDYLVDSIWSHNTVNIPGDFPFKDFKDIYMHAYDQGLKGCTTFRFNPEVFTGVLVKDKDLENTTYQFTLSDGSTISVKGNEEIEYDGEKHIAANLYDAIKEGYYAKY